VRGQAAVDSFAVGRLRFRHLCNWRKLVYRQVCDQRDLRIVQLFDS